MAVKAWLTPDGTAAGYIARRLLIPDELPFIMAVNGALSLLMDPANWEQYGILTPDEAAGEMEIVVLDFFQSGYSYTLGLPFPFLTEDPPPHSLELNGQTITNAETTHRALWDVIDPSLKSGSDITLPDWRGRFIVGAGGVYDLGDIGGSDDVTLTVNQMPAHTHTYTPPIANVDVEPPVGAPDLAAGISLTPANTGSTGGDQPHENRPPYYAVRWAMWVN